MIFLSQLMGRKEASPFLPNGSWRPGVPGVVWEMGMEGGLSPVEAGVLIDDLAAFGSPFIVFSAGTAELRDDLLILIRRARRQGMAAVLAIDRVPRVEGIGRLLAEAGLSLVLVYAPSPGAISFMTACSAAGLLVGVRQVLTSREALDCALSVAGEADAAVCLLQHPAPDDGEDGRYTRDLMDEVYRAACTPPLQIVTAGNRADAVYMYLRLQAENPDLAQALRSTLFGEDHLSMYGDVAYVNVAGRVFPEKHWGTGAVGDVRQRLFSQIWTDPKNPLLRGLRYRRLLVQGRCRICGFLEVCDGNQRARAAAFGDPWAEDPGCYLTDEEIRSK